MALRPFESVDGGVMEPGKTRIEWGILETQLQQDLIALAMPRVVVRLGLFDRVEIGLHGVYRLSVAGEKLPWDGTYSAGNFGIYAKWAIVPGALQNAEWFRPSVAVQAGADFFSPDARFGASTRIAGSMWIGPVLAHLNLGFHYEDRPRVIAGAVLEVHLRYGLSPVVEASGEVNYGPHPSVASILFGLVEKVPHVPLSFDLAARHGLSAGAPEWTFLFGMTMDYSLWHVAAR